MVVCEDCGNEYTRINQHHAMSSCGSDSGAKKDYECEHCGDVFSDYPSRRETRGRKRFFCSKDCKDDYERKGKEVECSWCGESLYRPPAQLESMGDYAIDNHFCDKNCEQSFKRINWVRQGHPSWKGGKVGVNTVRTCLAIVNQDSVWFRVADEEREDACEKCGHESEDCKLDVHHIVPVSAGGSNHPDNLMTLCKACHRTVEAYTKRFTEPHLLKPTL